MAFSKTIFAATAIGAVLALAGTETASANLLVNGDFESTNNAFSTTDTPVGWANIGHSDGVIAYSVFGTPAYNGSYFYDLGGYGNPFNAPGDGIQQTVSTVVGQTYTLTFGLTGENRSGTEIADVMIGSLLSQYTLTENGAGDFLKPFTTYTISYVATGTTTTIGFTTDALSPSLSNNDPVIDGVSFDTGGTVSAVPLPAALPLFATGLGALGLLGWRRKRKAAAIAA